VRFTALTSDAFSSEEVGASDAVGVARWPLYELDSVSIRVTNETGFSGRCRQPDAEASRR
jgi:hypothetical protein